MKISSQSKIKYKFKTQPYSHQKKALNKILQLGGRCGLFMDMGTGKTKVAIDWAGIGFHNFRTRKVLVIAPLSVLGVWPRQIKQHCPVKGRVFILRGRTDERVNTLKLILRSNRDDLLTWVVINYEGIWREPTAGAGMEKLLKRWKPDLIIFDESHRLKSHSSKQSRTAARIAREVKHRLLLTGTPITKAPLDIFGQFRAMNSSVFGTKWWDFKEEYGMWGGFHRYQLRGYQNLDKLIPLVRQNSYRIKKEQCLDLPPKVYETVPITLSDKAQKIYHEMAEQMIAEIEQDTHATASIVLVKLLRLSQITSGFVKDAEGNIRNFDDSKLNACIDLVRDIVEEGNKVVIFVRFRNDIDRLEQELTRFKIDHVKLSGTVPSNRRDSIVQRFHDDPDLPVFISQIQAGSLGIDLTPASIAIFFSMDYNAANYWQAQDRLHRIGQDRKVTYYHLVAPRTIDQVVLSILKSKGDLAEAVIHKPRILLG